MANSPILLHEHNEYIDVGVYLEVRCEREKERSEKQMEVRARSGVTQMQGIELYEKFLSELSAVTKLPRE